MAGKYRAIWKDGKLLAEYEGGELIYLSPTYSHAKRSDLATPYVMKDIGAYQSPIDGSMVTSRPQHRDHMRAHDVIEVGNEKIGNLTAIREKSTPSVDFDLACAIKRRIEEVASIPQKTYDTHVEVQKAEHAEVASLVVAS